MSNNNLISGSEKYTTFTNFFSALKETQNSISDDNVRTIFNIGAFSLSFALIENRVKSFLIHVNAGELKCINNNKNKNNNKYNNYQNNNYDFKASDDFKHFIKSVKKLLIELDLTSEDNLDDYLSVIVNFRNLSNQTGACILILKIIKFLNTQGKSIQELNDNLFLNKIFKIRNKFSDQEICDFCSSLDRIDKIRDERNALLHNAFGEKYNEVKKIFNNPENIKKLGIDIDKLVSKVR